MVLYGAKNYSYDTHARTKSLVMVKYVFDVLSLNVCGFVIYYKSVFIGGKNAIRTIVYNTQKVSYDIRLEFI